MKNRRCLLLVLLFMCHPLMAKEVDHSLFNAVLKTHVIKGKVNYAALRNDKRLERYIAQLSKVNPRTITSKQDQLAFWINVYNANTLLIVCQNYPLKSIKDIGSIFKSVWNRKFIAAGGQTYSLNTIEHKIIRVRYKDPRIHFALVCAAKSCPPLRSEAYKGSRLHTQLHDQGQKFIQNVRLNRFNIPGKKAYLSSIFKWYRKDFAQSDNDFLNYLATFLTPAASNRVKKDSSGWKIYYMKYNWRLNRQ